MAMEIKYLFTERLPNLLSNLIGMSSHYEDSIDDYGVGAMMPQDMPAEILLTNTDLYGV
jgi:hypothetical protein